MTSDSKDSRYVVTSQVAHAIGNPQVVEFMRLRDVRFHGSRADSSALMSKCSWTSVHFRLVPIYSAWYFQEMT